MAVPSGTTAAAAVSQQSGIDGRSTQAAGNHQPLTNYGVVHEVARSGYEISASARASLKRKDKGPNASGL
ncbi:hypothetical protein ACKZDW_20665 [Ralstonia syzygii subsp. celebesensis]|uniref:hypothetical protein n=1 Tax=Ralstonia syzygii TaxID=28097 RepID=UPI00387E0380